MADIESTVALDISDALGSIDRLGAEVRSEVGDAFDSVVDQFQSRLAEIDIGGALSGDLGAAAELFGEALRNEVAASSDVLSAGIAEAAGVGAAQVGEAVRNELAGATDGLSENIAAAGLVGAAAILDTGEQAVDALSANVRDELGSALSDAAQQFSAALTADSPLESLDLSDAVGQLQSLQDASQETGDSLQDTAGDLGVVDKAGKGFGDTLSGALQVAQGETGSVKGLAGALGGVGAGFVAAGTAATVFAVAGLHGVAATERLDQVFGPLADKLEHISVGGLNGDLDKLAVKAGSTSAPLKNILADLGQFVQAGGATQGQAVGIAEKFSALTLRAIALKPSLGDAGEAGQRLFTALASGRDRALVPFALGIDQAQVKAQALKLGLIDTIDQALTPTQRIMAGVSLATEKAGDSLGTQFAQGADQAAVKAKALKATLEQSFEKLGEPLVEPLLALGDQLLPLAEQIGKIAASIITALLPALESAAPLLSNIADVLDVVLEVVEALGPALPAIAFGFLAFKAADFLPGLLRNITAGFLTTELAVGKIDFETATTRATKAGNVIKSIGEVGPIVAAGLGVGIASMHDFGESTTGTIGTLGGFTAAGAGVGFMFGGPVGAGIGAAAGAVVGLTAGLIAGGKSVEDYRAEFAKLGAELDRFSQKQATEKFIDQLGDQDVFALATGNARGLTDELKALATTSPAAAEKVVAGLKAMRDEGGKPLFNAKEAAKLDAAVKSGTVALNKANAEKSKADERNKTLASTSAQATVQLQRQADAEAAEAKALQDMTDQAVSALPAVGQAFDDATGNAEAFSASVKSVAQDGFNELQKAVDTFGVSATPQNLQDALQHRLDVAARFQFDLLTILQNGNRDLAKFLSEQGPDAAGGITQQIAQGIRDGQPELATAIEGTLDQIKGIDGKLAGALTLDEFRAKLFGQIISTAEFGDNLTTIVEAGFGSLAKRVSQLGPEKGGEVARQLAEGIRNGQPEVSKQLEDLLDFKEAQADKFGDDFKNVLAGKIAAGAKAGVDAARTSMEEIPGVIGEITPEATNSAASLGDVLASSLGRSADRIPDVVGGAIRDGVGKVREGESDYQAAGGRLGESVANAFGISIGHLSEKATEATRTTGDAVREGLGEAATISFFGGFAIGDSIGRGILAGISAVAADIAAGATSVVDGVLAGVKAHIESSSPSRLFAREVGLPIAQGIALGIGQGSDAIQGQIVDAVGVPPTIQGRVTDVSARVAASRPAGVADFPPPRGDTRGGEVHLHGDVILNDKVENPVREALRAGRALRDGASMVKLG